MIILFLNLQMKSELSAWWLYMVTLIFIRSLCGYEYGNMHILSPRGSYANLNLLKMFGKNSVLRKRGKSCGLWTGTDINFLLPCVLTIGMGEHVEFEPASAVYRYNDDFVLSQQQQYKFPYPETLQQKRSTKIHLSLCLPHPLSEQKRLTFTALNF